MKRIKNLSLAALLLSAVMLLTACAAKPVQETAVPVSDEAAASAVSTTAAAEIVPEVLIDEVQEGDYTFKIAPVFQKDGTTVAAAYILSVKNKEGKLLTEKDFAALYCVVAATGTQSAIKLTKNGEAYTALASYADEKGNLLTVQDELDVNKNGNKTEFLKLTKVTEKNQPAHYLFTDTVVKIVVEKNTVYAVFDGKKIKVDTVDAKNTKVKVKMESAAEQTEKAKASRKKNTKKKKTDTTTAKKSASTTKADGSNATTSKTDTYAGIVLLKDGQARSSANGVELSDNQVRITKGGDYLITAETDDWHGIIRVELTDKDKAELRFENVHISYKYGNILQVFNASESTRRDFIEAEANSESVAYDALSAAMDELADVKSAPDVALVFPSGTSSTFECSANIKTGVIYNEAKLEIKGNGKVNMTATANANNVLCSTKSITFKNVSAALRSAAYGATDSIGGCKGIFSYGKVNIESGSVSVHANGDCIRCDRFAMDGGTAELYSSACDSIDAEDSIDINGGKITAVALQKSSFKVRRVNNQEHYDIDKSVAPNDCMRSGKGDHFKITGGTVRGESKKISDHKFAPTQKTVICRTVKSTAGNAAEVKNPVRWQVGSVASSDNYCIKFLYSSSGVSHKDYEIKINGKSNSNAVWIWNDNYGRCNVVSSTSR